MKIDKKALLWFAILLVGFTISGCGKGFYSGSTESGFSTFPRHNKISPEKAIELAGPYLDRVYELRRKNLDYYNEAKFKSFDMVVLKGKYYYVVRDNRPHKLINFYIPYAIKVNKNTGEITAPDEKTDAMVQYKNF